MLANCRALTALIPALLCSCLVLIVGCADSDSSLRRIEVDVAGIAKPGVVSGHEAPVPDDAVVIGVEVGSVARAYVVQAFEVRNLRPADAQRDPEVAKVLGRHVVNDVIDGTAISVTHSDRNRCTRVLTDADSAEELEIGVGGWDDGMLLLIDGERVPQAAQDVPFEDVPFEVTTWEQWREEHPHTDVYIGG